MARLRTIGTGSTGSAIGAVVSRGGNTVELFSQGHAARPISGEVVLAVRYGACSWRSSCPGRRWRSCTALPDLALLLAVLLRHRRWSSRW